MTMSFEKVPCPVCGASLRLDRVQDLTTLEFRARCASCGWKGALRSLHCGGCHRRSFFKWDGKMWGCIDCGHARKAPEPRSRRPD